MSARYKITATEPDGKKMHFNAISKLAEALGIEQSTLRHKLSKEIGRVVYIKGWKVYVEIDDPTPKGVWALFGGKVFSATTLYNLGNQIGTGSGALTRRWESLGKPDTFDYNDATIGLGKYAGPLPTRAKPEVKPWKTEPEYTEDRIAPRLGGLLGSGYTVHGLGIRR